MNGDALLEVYSVRWTELTGAAKVIHHLFDYLNRHWIRRQIDENQQSIFYISTMILVLWREVLFINLKGKLIPSALQTIEKHRHGEAVAVKYVKDLVESMSKTIDFFS